MTTSRAFSRSLLCVLAVLAGGLLGGCDVEPRVVRLRPPPTRERAKLPPAPDLKPGSEATRYDDGSFSVDGLLGEARTLVGQRVRLKGYVHKVNVCDVDVDAECTTPPHAYIVDDPKKPKRSMLVVGSLNSRLPKLQPGNGETLEGTLEQISPDGRFIRARGILVLPDLPPPPKPVDAGATE